jgi:hypothetical protein
MCPLATIRPLDHQKEEDSMTIDAVIMMLEEAKTMLPSGGRAHVVFPDENLLMAIHADPEWDYVVVTDEDEDRRDFSIGDLHREQDWEEQ